MKLHTFREKYKSKPKPDGITNSFIKGFEAIALAVYACCSILGSMVIVNCLSMQVIEM